MTDSEKFEHLKELTLDDVVMPSEGWVAYAVCAGDEKSCGWQGWILEAISRDGKQLPADTRQICPVCDEATFRTWAKLQFRPSPDQPKIEDFESAD